MKEWFDKESFWRTMYPFMFPRDRFGAAAGEVDKVLALASSGCSAALDLCCGPGRHSVALAKRGLHVTGVDKTPFLLNKAKRRARAQGVKVEWVLSDMREFVRPDSYDLALSMFTSFGYFENKDDDVTVLRNLHRTLRTGGALVMDMAGKEWVARVFQPTTSTELRNGSVCYQRHEVLDSWTRMRNEWTVLKGGRARSYTFAHTLYSGQELRDRLFLAGFDDIRLCGDLDGNEYGPNAKRLVAVARKA